MQTDDRLALKEITRQLQLENTVGDRVFVSSSSEACAAKMFILRYLSMHVVVIPKVGLADETLSFLQLVLTLICNLQP